jgi:putative ABC transport system permease protein
LAVLNIRARKMLRDLWGDKSRTVLAVLSIAVGIFALSLTLRAQAILARNMLATYAAITPADITLTVQPFDQQLVTAIRRLPDIQAAEGQSHLDVRVRVGGQWRPMILTAIPDFQRMQVNKLQPAGGAWPPPKHTLLLERSYLDVTNASLGTPLLIETPAGQQFQVPIAGLAHDLTAVSGQLGSPFLFGYVSLDTSEWLGLSHDMNNLQIVVRGDPYDSAHIRHIVDELHARLEDAGRPVLGTRIRDRGKPELYGIITSILQTLGMLGVLSLVLSAFLVMNTIMGLLARQVPQIGVLKAIGAPRSDIVLIYLGGVLTLAVLALLVAVPLALLGANALALRLGQLFNYDINDFSVPAWIIMLEILAGLIVPLLAGLYPIITGTSVTVRQAIAGQGGAQFGRDRVDRLLGRLRGGPVTQLYALRNMVRRKGRLALTLAALALGGAIAIAVLSVRASMFATLDQISNYWQQDITLTFDQPRRADQIVHQILQVPGVAGVENQPARLGVRQQPNGGDAEQSSAIFGVQANSTLLQPTVVQGRWLIPQDTDGAVVNVGFLKHEPDVRLGDTISLNIAGRKTRWTVVGVVTAQLFNFGDSAPDQGIVYANLKPFAEAIRDLGGTNRMLVVTTRHDPAFQDQVAQALETQFSRERVHVVVQTRTAVRAQVTDLISAIVLFLLVMVCLFILVAGLSLMGTMSLNVLERTKEIGVLRAIGSSSAIVLRIVLTEGLYIGVLSWLLATLLAVPLSKIISDVIGWSIVSWPLVYTFPPAAALIWLTIVIVVAVGASYLPAANAAQLSVRDVLAYEG